MQFICFVGHNFADREAKIGFLAHDVDCEGIILCWLRTHQPFEKKKINDLIDYTIEQVEISFGLPIKSELDQIKKCEYVNYSDSAPGEGLLIVQTTTEIWLNECRTGTSHRLTSGYMSPILIQRGYNNTFYYASNTIKGTDVEVQELTLNKVGNSWIHNTKEVHVVREGNIIALEMDPENRSKTDSIYTHGNTLIENRSEVTNNLYIVDDKENLYYYRQKRAQESGNRYALIKNEYNLAQVKNLTVELLKYKKKPFNRMVISDRVLTLNDTNFSFANYH